MRPADDLGAGKLDQRINLLAPTYSPSGDEITGYTSIVANVPAEKRAVRGREMLAAARDVSEVFVVWRIRWRTGVNAIARLTHGADIYDVEAVVDPTGHRRVLELTARIIL